MHDHQNEPNVRQLIYNYLLVRSQYLGFQFRLLITLTSTTTAQLNNVLINGTISNNNAGTLMFYSSSTSFGAAWNILMNPWITNNLNSAQLNIHNLVVLLQLVFLHK